MRAPLPPEAHTSDFHVALAGVSQSSLLLRAPVSEVDDVLWTNLRGAILCSKAALPLMLKQKSGCIVHVGSVLGLDGGPGSSVYSASKAGLLGASVPDPLLSVLLPFRLCAHAPPLLTRMHGLFVQLLRQVSRGPCPRKWASGTSV